jgi:hypothetical protein
MRAAALNKTSTERTVFVSYNDNCRRLQRLHSSRRQAKIRPFYSEKNAGECATILQVANQHYRQMEATGDLT